MSTQDSRVDREGYMHAEWCASVVAHSVDDCDLCDCNPCNTCEGHGAYGDESGNPMECIACNGTPYKKRGERWRSA